MKTGRRDSKESHVEMVEDSIPNHNDSISLVLSRFQSVGIDTEGTVALLGMNTPSPTKNYQFLDPQNTIKGCAALLPTFQALIQLAEFIV